MGKQWQIGTENNHLTGFGTIVIAFVLVLIGYVLFFADPEAVKKKQQPAAEQQKTAPR